jgi:hypothetical protein
MIGYKKDGTIDQFPVGVDLHDKQYTKVVMTWEEWFWTSTTNNKYEYLEKVLSRHAENIIFKR